MFLVRWVSRLPWKIIYTLSDLLFFIAYYLLQYRKDVVKNNLMLAFPEKSQQERNIIAKQFYRNLCDVILEIIKTLTISVEELNERIRVANPELLEEYLQSNQSVIVMTGHLGNWEWIPQVLKPMFPQYSFCPVYKQLSDAFSNNLMLQIRSRFGIEPILKEHTLREVAKRRKAGQVFCLGLVADQSPAKHELEFKTNFFNIPTYFYTGGEKLARQTGFPVLYAVVQRLKRGCYVLEFEKLQPSLQSSNQIIKTYVDLLEKSIKKQPADWLWSHKRWKFSY
ncbi:MAG: lysophospholipid acyltransferase family protein [Cytophagales bacterium]|nr:lysophospholipid acyltransferase family protein [Bernardetiaceae bacterium]MDW8209651.1 lysophospholipid acyltransferase family protein [Cytophagales bacterium]